MDNKTIIITGSNYGIGKETALDLLSNGAKVVFACQDQQKTMEVINSISDHDVRSNAYFIRCDLSNFKSINSFVENFHSQFPEGFDIFINNTADNFERFGKSENIENTFMVNNIGPMVLLMNLFSYIKPQGRIINITSKTFTFLSEQDIDMMLEDKDFSGLQNNYKKVNALAFARLAFLAFTQHLDQVFQKQGSDIKIVNIDPGVLINDPSSDIKSGFMRSIYYLIAPVIYLFVKDTKIGARSPLNLAYMEHNQLASAGYYIDDKLNNISSYASNATHRKTLLDFSYEQIKSNYEMPTEFIKFF